MANAWQAYVDNLISSGNVDQAAIISIAGDSVWAQSQGFNVDKSLNEIKTIITSFSDTKDVKDIQKGGFHLNKEKYMTITADDTVVVGKKGREGAVAAKSKMCILIAHHPDTIATQNARSTVEGMAQYLVSSGY